MDGGDALRGDGELAAVVGRVAADHAEVERSPAAVSSSSTPVSCAPIGAKPRKFPDPQPGSRTRTGPVAPNAPAACQMACTTAAEV